MPTSWTKISNTQPSDTNNWTDIANTQASTTDAWTSMVNTGALSEITIPTFNVFIHNLYASSDVIGLTAVQLRVLIPDIFYIIETEDDSNYAVYNIGPGAWVLGGDAEVAGELVFEEGVLYSLTLQGGSSPFITNLFYSGTDATYFFPTSWSDISNTQPSDTNNWTDVANTQANDTDAWTTMINTQTVLQGEGVVEATLTSAIQSDLYATSDAIGLSAVQLRVLIPDIKLIAESDNGSNYAFYHLSLGWLYSGDINSSWDFEDEVLYSLQLQSGSSPFPTDLFYPSTDSTYPTTSWTNVHNTYAWTIASGLPDITIVATGGTVALEEVYVYTAEAGVDTALGKTAVQLKAIISDFRSVVETDNASNYAVYIDGSWNYNGTIDSNWKFEEGVSYKLTLMVGSDSATSDLFYAANDLPVSWSSDGKTLVRVAPDEVELNPSSYAEVYAQSSTVPPYIIDIQGYTLSQISDAIPTIFHIHETDDASTLGIYIGGNWIVDTIGNIEVGVSYKIALASGSDSVTTNLFYDVDEEVPTVWSDISNTQASADNSFNNISNTQPSDTNNWTDITNTEASTTNNWTPIDNTKSST